MFQNALKVGLIVVAAGIGVQDARAFGHRGCGWGGYGGYGYGCGGWGYGGYCLGSKFKWNLLTDFVRDILEVFRLVRSFPLWQQRRG
jgi:hypothetical protein